MPISVFDLFKIGLGPSSSHALGPMRAAKLFIARLRAQSVLDECAEIHVYLYGSLALTGRGHGTDKAIQLGLEGCAPDAVDPDEVEPRLQVIRSRGQLSLDGGPTIAWNEQEHLHFISDEFLPQHPNGMRFVAQNKAGEALLAYTCFSVGGGFIVDESSQQDGDTLSQSPLPYPYHTAAEMLAIADSTGLSISGLTLANEQYWRSEAEVRAGLLARWQVMQRCVERGCRQSGYLPGPLQVRRRAPELWARLSSQSESTGVDALAALDWVDLFALAVSEENAAGGRVVTAPTNGAAGIIPSVLHYYWRFIPGASEEGIVKFLLTAGAIGILYKLNASLSGAEVGCQGEVGVACSMAAGALTEVLGGNVRQVEMAAEIGMEHNLGLTCDPVGGLVQIPCIERCAMGAVKAINAARLALGSDGQHCVSLDRVIKTMLATGRDMQTKYKETSRGGLAVAVPEC